MSGLWYKFQQNDYNLAQPTTKNNQESTRHSEYPLESRNPATNNSAGQLNDDLP